MIGVKNYVQAMNEDIKEVQSNQLTSQQGIRCYSVLCDAGFDI